AGEVDGDQVHVGGGGEAGHVVPQRVQPEPGLARIAARLVHDPPLVTGQVHGGGLVREVGAIAHEQQRLGEVGAVEVVLRQQVGVERTAAALHVLGGQHDRHRAVGGARHDRVPAHELHVGDGLEVGIDPCHLLGVGSGVVGGQGDGQPRVGAGQL